MKPRKNCLSIISANDIGLRYYNLEEKACQTVIKVSFDNRDFFGYDKKLNRSGC